jgi:hypothetical protein
LSAATLQGKKAPGTLASGRSLALTSSLAQVQRGGEKNGVTREDIFVGGEGVYWGEKYQGGKDLK